MKRRLLTALLLMMTVLALVGCTIQLRAQLPYQSPHTYEQLRIDMLATVEPTVVVVRTETGHGSGIIYHKETLENNLKRYAIMTNYHVVEDGGEMSIYFGPGTDSIPVKDVAGYEPYDIAVVRIETTRELAVHNSPAINDSVRLEIVKGQDVYAIGTPQNIDKFNYVTSGVVSMTTYAYNGIPGLALMHNAELNPGNSGGPLFNLNGDLIGINVAKVSVVGGDSGTIAAEGLNYSLNINKIAPVVASFSDSDFEAVVRRPRLGITVQEVDVFLENNDPSLLPSNPVGVVVIDLDPTRDSYGKIQVYDLIIDMNGSPVTSIADIASQLQDAAFGDLHTLKVLRKVGDTFQEFTYTITLS